MNTIADTSIWSLFFRRKRRQRSPEVTIFRELIQTGQISLPGIIKQELLSGIREETQYQKLKDLLSSFPALLATEEDHILASLYFNQCRRKGIQGSFVDFLICAQSTNNQMMILTTGKDFDSYAKVLDLHLLKKN